MAQNTWFMVKLAFLNGEKKVPVLCLLLTVLRVCHNLVNLYIAPSILSGVERHVALTELLITIGGFVLALMLVTGALKYVDANTMFGRISVRMELITLLNRKAATTSCPNLEEERFKKLLTKALHCTNSNDRATEAIWGTLTDLATNILGFVIYVSLLTRVQPLILAVILLTTVTGYFIGNYLNGYGYRHRDEEAEYVRHMEYISKTAKDLGAAKDIRIFGLGLWLGELQEKAMGAYMAFHKKAQGVYVWAAIADLTLAFVRNALAYFFLIQNLFSGGLGVTEFLLLLNVVDGFSRWVSGIMGSFGTLYRQSLDISTVRECLEYEEPFLFEQGLPLKADKRESYEIRMENVSFRYPGARKDVLTDINLTLHPGEKLAVVGLNGAGKTTLVKLICGLLDPTQGRVLLNGKDIREYNRKDYYAMFSAVFQDYSLLAGTIAQNIAQREEGIDMELVRQCAKKAGIEEKIESLPEGYGTYLNREVYENAILLSGGETQRLMLARALYKDAPFIILDEPTAALDAIAESDLYQKYNALTRDRSSVYISHRLASTRFCSRIIMIDHAEIIEEGTHQELLRLGGRYAGLYELQSKYYREGEEKDER